MTSVLCAIAQNPDELITARALQGVAGALLLPQTVGIIRTVFTEPKRRARVMGIWSGVSSLGLVIGPIVGGLCAWSGSWRWGFVVTIVLALTALLLAIPFLPGDGSVDRVQALRSIDWVGATIGALFLASLTMSIMSLSDQNAPLLRAVLLLVVAVVLFVIVVFQQRYRSRNGRDTLVPPSLWKVPSFIAANTAGFAYMFTFLSIVYYYSAILQEIWMVPAVWVGVVFIAMMGPTAIIGVFAGRLAAWAGPERVVVLGLLVAVVGTIIFVFTPIYDGSWTRVLIPLIVVGVAAGLISSTTKTLAVADVEPKFASNASATQSMFRQLGSTFGIAIIGGFIALHGARHDGHPTYQVVPVSMLAATVVLLIAAFVVWKFTQTKTVGGNSSEVLKHKHLVAFPHDPVP